MKSLRLDRWASQLQPPRNPRLSLSSVPPCPFASSSHARLPRRELQQRYRQIQTSWQNQRRGVSGKRRASSAAAPQFEHDLDHVPVESTGPQEPVLNFPSHVQAMKSAKLAALHARLSLPTKLPRQTLARCLIDPTVDARPDYNNIPLATLGRDLLSYYTSEWLICKYPRIPMAVLFAAQDGYVGPGTLNAMRMEWGVEAVAAPGPEVDPGLLQLKRKTPGNAMAPDGTRRLKDVEAEQAALQEKRGRRTISGKIVYDDEFGEPGELPTGGVKASSIKKGDEDAELAADEELEVDLDMDTTATATATTVEQASARFVRALVGALYLHAGKDAAKAFHHDHVLSRHLPLHNLFNFRFPTRDLSLLCKREGFEPPVARLISETGRLSRTPVFVVGIFSGEDKLGEGVGASLDEARVRAAAAALRSWYLYSPPASEIFLPSEFDGSAARTKQWKPQYIDPGEIVQ